MARRHELDLIPVLLASDDPDGTIGKRAGQLLKRLPSSIYWTGLGRLGIRRFPASQDAYHRSLDTWYRRRRAAEPEDVGDHISSMPLNWHAGIPEPPSNWPRNATLRLRAVDAQYLRECIRTVTGESLLARMDGRVRSGEDVPFAWDHPVAAGVAKADDPISRALCRQLDHARCFSDAMFGAAILYNLIVAEQIPGGGDRVERYRQLMSVWQTEIDARMAHLRKWNLTDMWQLMAQAGARVHPLARDFVTSWVQLTRSDQFKADTTGEQARRLVAVREKRLKGPLARIDNPSVQERWEGDSGLGRFDFRWSNARIVLSDIAATLDGGDYARAS